ncbi:TPA: rhamnosyltransferase [Escherichia coli]|nr:rhamnosyltransferase [Escherichia coli]
MKNKVAGVIVTYNPEIKILLSALESSTKQLDYIYLIDNCSLNKNEVADLAGRFGNVKFQALSKNIGLASAQNMGINTAKNNNLIEYVVLFDQDSIIENNFIASLLDDYKKVLAKDSKIGAIGPVFYVPSTKINYPATVYIGPFIKKISIKDEPQFATYLIASGCLIKIDTLSSVGLMQDDLFIDYIDVEWSLRAKSKGYNLYISPNAKMAHTIGDARRKFLGRTISIHSPFRRYFLVRNSFYMIRLNYIPLGYKTRECIFNIARILTSIIYSDQKIKTIKSAFYGVIDGIAGRFGPLKRKI